MLNLFVGIAGDDAAQRVGRILIAVLVHVHTGHGKLGLGSIAGAGIVRGELICHGFSRIETARHDVLGQRLVQNGSLQLRIQFAIRVVVQAREQRDTQTQAANDVAAVLRPP